MPNATYVLSNLLSIPAWLGDSGLGCLLAWCFILYVVFLFSSKQIKNTSLHLPIRLSARIYMALNLDSLDFKNARDRVFASVFLPRQGTTEAKTWKLTPARFQGRQLKIKWPVVRTTLLAPTRPVRHLVMSLLTFNTWFNMVKALANSSRYKILAASLRFDLVSLVYCLLD